MKKEIDDVMKYIDNALGYKTLLKPPKWWLDLKNKRVNAVFGSQKYGICAGKLYLIAGKESSGKTAKAARIAGLAQKYKHAHIAWVDAENSYDARHMRKQGLHSGKAIREDGRVVGYSKIALFTPKYGKFKLSKKVKNTLDLEEVEPAEYMLTRVEAWMKIMRKKHGDKCRLVVVIDSTNALSPKEEQEAGYVDANMRTKTSPAILLNSLTKRFGPLSVHTNAIVILIAQLRTDPGKMFGNPEYISGGGGLKFHPSCIVWMRRVADGAIYEGGNKKNQQIGVKGVMTNTKNKVGGGSVERKRCGYIAHFFKDDWKFVSYEAIKKEK